MSQPTHLKCEYLVDPLGIDEARPRLSWLFHDPATSRGAVQTAYQIAVASSLEKLEWDQPDVWDSGKTAGNLTSQIEYGGTALASRRRYWWKVRTWNGRDEASPWSAAAFWEMGLLERQLWQGQWIKGDPRVNDRKEFPGMRWQGQYAEDQPVPSVPCPVFRRTFRLDRAVRSARVYITARGLYELHVNGQRVGEDCLTPGWTEYRKRLLYQTYDVGAWLKPGDNVIGAILADGWFCGHLAWFKKVYGHEPALLAQVHVTFDDDSELTFATDASWKVRTGPLLQADLYMGETYDARLEAPGWAAAGFDDGSWVAARAEPLDEVALEAGPSPRVHRWETRPPAALHQPLPGVFVYDMGQNMVGWVRLHVPAGLPAGTALRLRHAEMLAPDGTLWVDNLRGARQTDTFITRDGAAAEYEPRFTFHGFRYVELTVQTPDGAAAPNLTPTLETLTGVVAHSHISPAGTFACSHELLTRLQQNIQWGQRGNFVDVPTDCPQRAERLGWTGDAQVFAPTACFNADCAAFYTKWLADVRHDQTETGTFVHYVPDVATPQLKQGSPAWADAGVIVPWAVYQAYGDRRILERSYASMCRFVDYMKADSTDLIRPDIGYGDWLSVNAFTPRDLIGTAFFAHSTELVARTATVLGRKRDAARYATLARRVKAAFVRRFVTPEGRIVGDTQTGYLLALRFDLLPAKLRAAAFERLVYDVEKGSWSDTVVPLAGRSGHLSTGFVGTPYLTHVLSDLGRLDVAYRLLFNEDFPSWLMPVKNGATTIWERWDSWTPQRGFNPHGMNSFNHYAFGAIGEWMYRVIGGIRLDPAAPGYRHVLIHPQPDATRKLTWARCAHDSIHGRIETHWRLEDATFRLDVAIPANVAATVAFAAPALETVQESGRPAAQAPGVAEARCEGGAFSCRVGSGEYRFAAPVAATP